MLWLNHVIYSTYKNGISQNIRNSNLIFGYNLTLISVDGLEITNVFKPFANYIAYMCEGYREDTLLSQYLHFVFVITMIYL